MTLKPRASAWMTLLLLLLSPMVDASAQSVEEVLDIGEVDGPAERMFTRIQSVVIAGDGSIVVLEASDPSIRVFGPDGRFLRRIGRRGEGPGEFRALSGAAMVEDTLVVFDWILRRLSYFSLDGTLHRTRMTRFSLGIHGSPRRLSALPEGALLLETEIGCMPPRREGTDAIWRLILFSADSPDPREVMRAPQTRTHPVYTPDGRTCTVVQLPFAPGSGAAVGPDGVVAFGTGEAPAVALHERVTGRTTSLARSGRSLTTPSVSRPMATADRQWWRQAVLGPRVNPASPGPLDEHLRALGNSVTFPNQWAAYDRLLFDSSGELWLRQPPGGAPSARWDVIRRDGSHRGTISLPASLVVHAIVNNAVYGVDTGEWDEEHVKRYLVRWN